MNAHSVQELTLLIRKSQLKLVVKLNLFSCLRLILKATLATKQDLEGKIWQYLKTSRDTDKQT